jgi:hypothetical protein
MKKNNFVCDKKTLELVQPGEMLKRLMRRSGLKRDELYEKMQSYVKNRSIGSKSKLSDIFSGKYRQLPLRDLEPMIVCMGISEDEKDYYICEILKGYLPERLSRYVSTTRRNNRLMLDSFLIKELRDQIEKLKIEIEYSRHVDLQEPMPPQKEDYQNEDEYIFDLFCWEGQDMERSNEIENQRQQESSEAAERAYEEICTKWHSAICEIESNFPDKQTQYFISLLFPKKFQEDLFELFVHRKNPDSLSPRSHWRWVSQNIHSRPLSHVLGQLFIKWKKDNKERFSILDKHYKQYLQTSFHSIYKLESNVNCEGINFSKYISVLFDTLNKNYPNLYDLMSPWKGITYIDHSISEHDTFLQFYEYIDSGWSEKVPFEDRFELSIPSAKDDKNFFSKLTNIVLGTLISVTISADHYKSLIAQLISPMPLLSRNFNLVDCFYNFDDLDLKYESPIDYINQALTKGKSIEFNSKNCEEEIYNRTNGQLSKQTLESDKKRSEVLNELSRKCYEAKIKVNEAERRFNNIIGKTP